ncbi:hypothetical protein K438DRAFT_1976801 [Mycena galopus ATCC 62051]|nr:hypothetical protein K438DRAFT_1976801 [Mycena galopus ATCC 62051]
MRPAHPEPVPVARALDPAQPAVQPLQRRSVPQFAPRALAHSTIQRRTVLSSLPAHATHPAALPTSSSARGCPPTLTHPIPQPSFVVSVPAQCPPTVTCDLLLAYPQCVGRPVMPSSVPLPCCCAREPVPPTLLGLCPKLDPASAAR